MQTRQYVILIIMALSALIALQCQDMGNEPDITENRKPEITSVSSISITTGQRLLYRALASDPDGTTPVISFFGYPGWLIAANDSIFGVTPSDAADTSFGIVASDNQLADTVLVNITIAPINRPPVITSAALDSAAENENYVYHATATDPDGTTPSISFYEYPSWLTFDSDSIYGQAVAGTPDTSFTVVATDGLLSDTLTVLLTVLDAPAAISYVNSIQPIFTANCLDAGCHGMGQTPAAGLRLMTYNSLMQGSFSGQVIIPFQPDSSILVHRIESDDPNFRMPYLRAPLPDSSIELIRLWLSQGAQDN